MAVATMLRVEVQTESGTEILELARHSPYEHWIVTGWDPNGRGRVPKKLVRLEGLPFVPSGVNGVDYTVTTQLPDALMDGRDSYFKGRLIDVLDGCSPRALRIRIPKHPAVAVTTGVSADTGDSNELEEDRLRRLRRPRANSALWPPANCVRAE